MSEGQVEEKKKKACGLRNVMFRFVVCKTKTKQNKIVIKDSKKKLRILYITAMAANSSRLESDEKQKKAANEKIRQRTRKEKKRLRVSLSS